jgi:hypothetical protein
MIPGYRDTKLRSLSITGLTWVFEGQPRCVISTPIATVDHNVNRSRVGLVLYLKPNGCCVLRVLMTGSFPPLFGNVSS